MSRDWGTAHCCVASDCGLDLLFLAHPLGSNAAYHHTLSHCPFPPAFLPSPTRLFERECSVVVKNGDAKIRLPGFKSWLYYLLPVQLLASYFTSVCFRFFLCQMGIIIGPTS